MQFFSSKCQKKKKNVGGKSPKCQANKSGTKQPKKVWVPFEGIVSFGVRRLLMFEF